MKVFVLTGISQGARHHPILKVTFTIGLRAWQRGLWRKKIRQNLNKEMGYGRLTFHKEIPLHSVFTKKFISDSVIDLLLM
jgi:hypothetical protein